MGGGEVGHICTRPGLMRRRMAIVFGAHRFLRYRDGGFSGAPRIPCRRWSRNISGRHIRIAPPIGHPAHLTQGAQYLMRRRRWRRGRINVWRPVGGAGGLCLDLGVCLRGR